LKISFLKIRKERCRIPGIGLASLNRTRVSMASFLGYGVSNLSLRKTIPNGEVKGGVDHGTIFLYLCRYEDIEIPVL
jgi:hypothetical protein